MNNRSHDDRKVREVFLTLGSALSTARTPREAALATLNAADELFGWDSAFIDQIVEDEQFVRALVVMDTVRGVRQEVAPWNNRIASGGLVDSVLSQGSQLILRTEEELTGTPVAPFGDTGRRSASLMYAPILVQQRKVGLLSVQSYTPQAYQEADLELLGALAEYCGGAISRTAAEAERIKAVEALAREHDLLRGLLNALPDPIYFKDLESRFLLSNAAHLELLGTSSLEETIGRRDIDFFPPELGRQYIADERRVLETGEPLLNREEIVVNSKGEKRWMSTSKVPLRDAQNKLIGTVGMSRDITDRKKAEEGLFRSNALYHALLQASEDYIFVIGRDMRLLSANGVAARRYGLSVKDRIGKTYYDFIPKDLADYYTEFVRRVFETGQPLRYEDSGLVNGRKIYTETQLSPVFDPNGNIEAVMGVSRDITQRKMLEEELRNLSLIDDLTGLYNRRGFLTLAEQHIRMVGRAGDDVVLIYADLDGLKQINDTYGHQEGDAALIAAARVLQETFRQSDVIARLGGDEFTVLGLFEPSTTSIQIRERLEAALAACRESSDHPWSLSMSLGVARLSETVNRTLDELVALADESLYDQKRVRRGH